MSPYYEHAGITIYHGDCIDVMRKIQAVDHVIADPPYETEAHAKGARLNGRTAELKKSSTREIDASALQFGAMSEELRLASCAMFANICSGWVLLFCQAEAIAAYRAAMISGGIAWRRSMVWIKPDSAPQLSGDRPAMGYESIAAGWAGSGRSLWNGGGARGVFTHSRVDPGFGTGGRQNQHQTQKPLALMRELVALFTQPNQLILDAFMGSGSTLVAAKALGRRCIGVDLDERNCEIAANRMAQEALQFGDN